MTHENQPVSKPAVVKNRVSRAVLLAISGLLIIAAGVAYRHFQYARPIGTGPATPAVARELFQQP